MMSVKKNIVAQFKRPSGIIGRLAGYVMANRPSNIDRNSWTVSLLDIKPEDHVLEIGYGPGVGLQKAAMHVESGSVTGVDHSNVMFEQASAKNREAVLSEKMKLIVGTIDDLRPIKKSYNKCFSANVFQFWDDPVGEFSNLREVLSPGALLATTFMPRNSKPTKEDTRRMAKKIEDALDQSGFKNARFFYRTFNDVDAVCVLANRED